MLRFDQPYTRGERSRLAVTFLSGVAKKLQATKADAEIAHVLTMDEARRIASNIAKLPTFLAANPDATRG